MQGAPGETTLPGGKERPPVKGRAKAISFKTGVPHPISPGKMGIFTGRKKNLRIEP